MGEKNKKLMVVLVAIIIFIACYAVATQFQIFEIRKEDEKLSLIAKIFVDQNTGTAPLEVNFSALITNFKGEVDYLWDFGDGRTSEEKQTTIRYEKEGEYICNLKVTDESGKTQADFLKIVVNRNKPPVVTLSINQNTINRGFNWLELLSLTPIASYAGNKQLFLDSIEKRRGPDVWGKGRIIVTAQIMDPEDDEIVSYDWKTQTADTLVTFGGRELLPIKNLSGETNVTIPELYAWLDVRHIVTLTVTDSAGNQATANIDYTVSPSSRLTKIRGLKNTFVTGLPFILMATEFIWGLKLVEEPVSNFLDEIWFDLPSGLQKLILLTLGVMKWSYEPPIPKADLKFSEISDINLSQYVNDTNGEVQPGAVASSSFVIFNNDSENTARNVFLTLEHPITNEQGLPDELEREDITVDIIAGIYSNKLFYQGKYISWENCYKIEQLTPGSAINLELKVALKQDAIFEKGSYQCTLYVYQEKSLNKVEYIDKIPFTIII